MQLSRLVATAGFLVTTALAATAAADGEVSVRGLYYKEDATRVQQPMVDARLEVGEHGELETHFLIDVISSASVAAGNDGASFDEVRYEHGMSYAHRLARVVRLGLGYRVSTEPDYDSVFVSANGAVEVAQRNTVLAAAFAQGLDQLSNGNAGGMFEPVTGDVLTSLVSASVSQVVSPIAVAALTYDLSYQSGFLANPYRTVNAGGETLPEAHPDSRLRHAVVASVRSFVIPTDTALVASYRFYADDWGVVAHTPEARVIQALGGDRASARLRYRYYRQTATEFYREVYDRPQAFMTDDAKLAAFTGHTVGVRLDGELGLVGVAGRFERARAEVVVDYVVQGSRFGNGYVAQLALTVPLEY